MDEDDALVALGRAAARLHALHYMWDAANAAAEDEADDSLTYFSDGEDAPWAP